MKAISTTFPVREKSVNLSASNRGKVREIYHAHSLFHEILETLTSLPES